MSLSDKARKKAKSKALASLRKVGYHYVQELSQGKFSTVMCLSTSKRSRKRKEDVSLVAVKVTTAAREEEMLLWQTFDHDNVVHLISSIEVGELGVMVMPLYHWSLDACFVDPDYEDITEFGREPVPFRKTIPWVRDIAKGLAHLHGKDVCHLNLQPSNILIGLDMRAAIGGFGCIQKTTRPATNYGLPRQYSPPECWSAASEEIRPPVSGIPYDMWSLGMLAFNLWTGYTLEKRLWGLKDWKIDLYPHLFDALQLRGAENLRVRLTRAYPGSWIRNRDATECLNFLRGLLCRDPLQRPDTSRVLQHKLLSRKESWFDTDPIWETYQDGQSGVWKNAEEPSETNVSGECEESLPPETQKTREIDASGECEESLPPKTSDGVRSWFRKKWRSVKGFFCCKKPSD